jgi:uncharacterized protein YdaU (DUF1376 family)/DNA-binding CsgD family transcriptional regulator
MTEIALSPREIEVVDLLAKGKTPVKIARLLGLQCTTVSTHLRRVRAKVGAGSTLELAVRWAVHRVNYYPHHIGDYAKDTAHLSMLEDAAYRRMLDVVYATEKPLPRRPAAIYRLVRARTHAEKLAVDVVLGEFWVEGRTAGATAGRCRDRQGAARSRRRREAQPTSVGTAMRNANASCHRNANA